MPSPSPLLPQYALPLVLIIFPTRELAIWIFDKYRRYYYYSMFRPCSGENNRATENSFRNSRS